VHTLFVDILANSAQVGNEMPVQAQTGASDADSAEFRRDLSTYVLARYNRSCDWFNQQIRPRLELCARLHKGEYTAEQLAGIGLMGGTDIYSNQVRTKANALISLGRDALVPSGDGRSYDLSPSPVSDLPPEDVQGINNRVKDEYMPDQGAIMATAQTQEEYDALQDQLRKRVVADATALRERFTALVSEEAKSKCENLLLEIDDQLKEGGWYKCLIEILEDVAVFPISILKGPVLDICRIGKWDDKGVYTVTEEPTPCFSTVSPWDFRPSPNSRNINDDYVNQIIPYSLTTLSTVSKGKGWVKSSVDKVIADVIESRRGVVKPDGTEISQDRMTYEDRLPTMDNETAPIEAVEHWGRVAGSYLLDWAQKNEQVLADVGFFNVDPMGVYSITATLIGTEVVRVLPNLDPLGRFPFHTTSWSKKRGSLYGIAMPEEMQDIQQAVNMIIRAMLNNAFMSSGPMMTYDTAAGDAPSKIVPLMVIAYNSSQGGSTGRPPIDLVNVMNNAGSYLQLLEFWSSQADNRTHIPRFVYGEQADIGGAGNTATGLGMYLKNVAKGVRRVISNIDDDIQIPALSMLIAFNQMYSRDPALRGDANIIAKGALQVISLETQELRRREFLQMAMNPVFNPYFSPSGIAYVLRDLATSSDLAADKVIISDQEIEQREQARAQMDAMAQQVQQQQGAMQNGQPSGRPSTQDSTGPAGAGTRPKPDRPVVAGVQG
jgi:hypothetical protein